MQTFMRFVFVGIHALRVTFWSYILIPVKNNIFYECLKLTNAWCTEANWVPIWGPGSPWGPFLSFWVPILFEGPHFQNVTNDVHSMTPHSVNDFAQNVFPVYFNKLACFGQFWKHASFLGLNSAGEGPHLDPLHLRLGPHFDKIRSPSQLASFGDNVFHWCFKCQNYMSV